MEEQEKIRFRADNVMTGQSLSEFTIGYKYSSLAYTVLWPIEAIAALWLCWLHWRHPEVMGETAKITLICAAFLLLLDLIPRLMNRGTGSLQYKRSLVSNGGRPVRNEVRFTEDAIAVRNLDTDNRICYGYDQIRRVFETKNLLVLMLDYRMGFLVSKAGIDGGTYEDLAAFLLQKCKKLKRKKLGRIALGKWLHHIVMACAALLLVVSLLNLPWARYQRHLWTDPTAKASFSQLASSLEELDITGAEEETLVYMENYFKQLDPAQKMRVSKPLWLLSTLGCGEYDEDTWEWIPSTSGVYYLDLEIMDAGTVYTDFLRGISALAPEQLAFTMVTEDQSKVDWADWTGEIGLSFLYQGQGHSLTADLDGDWFDVDILAGLRDILLADADSRELYWVSDGGQGLLIVYREPEWCAKFQQATGLTLTNEIS